jgi:hypothetical protein
LSQNTCKPLNPVAEVGSQIPGDHWQALAGIAGSERDLRRRILRQSPARSSRRISPD